MYLLMHNREVRSQRIACPPAEALESACQLFGLPYRYEKRSGVFAVHPPLLGKNILIESVRPIRPPDSDLHARLKSEVSFLERLLWISGAEVIVRESAYLEKHPPSRRTKEHPHGWDLVLFLLPGQSIPNSVHPAAIYPWWQWARASYRLAGCLSAGSGPSSPAFTRASSLRVAKDVRSWFSEAIQDTRAPAVLLSIPLVEGYIDRFVEELSVVVSDGVLKYFRKEPLPGAVRDRLRQISTQAREKAPVTLALRDASAESTPPEGLQSGTQGTPVYRVEPPSTLLRPMAPSPVQDLLHAKQDADVETPLPEADVSEKTARPPVSKLELAQLDLARRREALLTAQKAAWRDKLERAQVPQIVIQPGMTALFQEQREPAAQPETQESRQAVGPKEQDPGQEISREVERPLKSEEREPVKQPDEKEIAKTSGQPATAPAFPQPSQQLVKETPERLLRQSEPESVKESPERRLQHPIQEPAKEPLEHPVRQSLERTKEPLEHPLRQPLQLAKGLPEHASRQPIRPTAAEAAPQPANTPGRPSFRGPQVHLGVSPLQRSVPETKQEDKKTEKPAPPAAQGTRPLDHAAVSRPAVSRPPADTSLSHLPRSQRSDEKVIRLRELLAKSPEKAAAQAAEILSGKGITPTPERVEEYVKYLNRMLFPQNPGDNTSS